MIEIYQLILVGGDGREDSFWENVSAELFALQIDDGTGRVGLKASDQMNSRLVPVHRIQNNLNSRIIKKSNS